MDFATISNLVQASGYTKANTQSSLINYDTLFTRGTDRISVKWQLGGYVHSISIGDHSGVTARFESAETFLNSFSEN